MTDLPDAEIRKRHRRMTAFFLARSGLAIVALLVSVYLLSGVHGGNRDIWWGLLALSALGAFFLRRRPLIAGAVWLSGCLAMLALTLWAAA